MYNTTQYKEIAQDTMQILKQGYYYDMNNNLYDITTDLKELVNKTEYNFINNSLNLSKFLTLPRC